jgi:hypothetical protein
MAHPEDYDFFLECGCTDMSHSLGIQPPAHPGGFRDMERGRD